MKGVKDLEKSSNFLNFVQKETHQKKLVLAFMYANWCGYCHRFANRFQNLANLIQNSPKKDSVSLVKMNGDKYEKILKKLKITSFPTILLYKPGNKEPIVYKGKFFLNPILNFLSEHSK
eukprot:gene1323-11406_t